MTATPRAEAQERLTLLTGYLVHDPANATLRLDAAEAALDAGAAEQAIALLSHAAIAEEPRARNIAGLAALQLRDWDTAVEAFATLAAGGAPPTVRFNLAWAEASRHNYEAALAALDAETTAEVPAAAMLEVQVLHQLARLDEALERAHAHLARFPDDAGLNAAVSVLAIDLELPDLAAECAVKAGDHPDALTSRATLALDGEDAVAARALFDRVLAHDDRSPRAWIGRGLARLMTGDAKDAPADLDRGAELFATHIGSWIAAGWAHLIAGDLTAARARFDTALALDAAFAESHGGLAVIDAMEGKVEAAHERAQVALRLDRASYGAALAQALLASAAGNAATATAIVERAMAMPIDDSGRTIGQMLTRMGRG
jgi:tetratricopeptide (TPR) repeat protein